MAQENEGPSLEEQLSDQNTVDRLVAGGDVRRGDITILDSRGENGVNRTTRPYVMVHGKEKAVAGEAAKVVAARVEIAERANRLDQLRAALAKHGSENYLKHRSSSGKELY